MLEHIAREDEIVSPISIGMRFGDVQARLAIVEGVGVIEHSSEAVGIIQLIAEPQSLERDERRS